MLGMSICAFDLRLKGKSGRGIIIGILFLGLSVAVYMANIRNSAVSFALGLMACAAIILLAVDFKEKSGRAMRFLAKYTMPIFLMHTLFAGTDEICFVEDRCYECAVHVALGLGISFAGPIMAA